MSDHIDHAAEAVSDIKYADEVLADGGDSEVAMAIASVAQVHATLALVEQQRIANLIALSQATHADGSRICHPITEPTGEYAAALRDDIRKGLGL